MASGETPENLRRSKRNKYHLDLTALNLVNPERRKQSTPVLKEESMETSSAAASPGTSNEKPAEMAVDDSTKRSRRPTTKNASFVYADESDDEDEKVVSGMFGSFKCEKCPSRFESRPGLANHVRLHGRSDKRKFGCDQCDFSCGSAKAIRNHNRIHSRGASFKEDSEVPTNSDNRSDTSDSHTPPLLTPVRTGGDAGPGQSTQETPPPKLAAISPQAKLERSGNRKRHRCQECPYSVRSRRRFEAHMSMHEKDTGFQCFYCTLSTTSSGFLKRHMVEIHKKTDFPWPPKWLGGAKKPKVQEAKKRGALLMRDIRQDGEKMACPIADCTYTGYTRSQIVFHKRQCHLKKPKRAEHRCCTCGLRLRTVGALRVHRMAKHPRKKLPVKAKRMLFREACPNSDIMKIMMEMRKVSSTTTGAATPVIEKSVPSTPKAPSPDLSTSQSAPALLESETVSSTLLGIDLPDCLKGMTFGIAELAAELAKSHDNEFRCDDCPFTTNARTKLERHTVKHEVKSDIQCPLCSFSCRGDDLIKQHVRLHMAIVHKKKQDEAEKNPPSKSTTPPELSTPPKMNGELPSEKKKTTLKRKKHSNVFINKDGIRMRRCLECPYVTKHACDLASHYNMHVSEPQRYKCTQCTYSTKRAVSLKTHFQCHKEHNEEFAKVKPWHIKANGFQIGVRTGAGKNRIYSCKSCPYVTKGLVLLHQHNRHHVFTKGAAYKCSKCPFYSMQCEVVEDHILIHSEMDVQTERLLPLTRGKRNLDEVMGRVTPVTRGKRTPKQSAASSPAPPVLIKEEPMDWKSLESEENSRNSDSKSDSLPLSLQKPLSVEVAEFIRPEPALMKILRREQQAEEVGQCPDCPYQESDELMMRLHRECHLGQPRLHKCDLCSFSCMAPEALHKHISLHVPAMSPNSEAQQRKKHAQRRRAAGTEVIPHGVPHFSCNRCTFKSLTKDGYQEHMMFHAQELQRRLMTTIKRANTDQKKKEEDEKKAKVAKRAPKKSDKFHACRLCSFRCETENAFLRHSEMHGRSTGHKCEICNYTAPTYSITLFHMMNHHSDQTLATLTKSAVLVPKEISMKVDRSEERVQKMADNVYKCNRCPGFTCYEILQLRRHYEANHCDTPEDQNAVESLAMGMMPRNSVVTTA